MSDDEIKLFTDIFEKKSLPARRNFFYRCKYKISDYRYKIYAYTLLLSVTIIFFRNELIKLIDLLK